MQEFDTLIEIARRKAAFDLGHNWSNGSETYLTAIKSEVDEVIEEIPNSRLCYLEDELADVLWNYLNALAALEKEADIDLSSVLARACNKYEERMSGIESGEKWSDIKQQQKQKLADEYRLEQHT